jgi:hypothetical protein
MSDWQMSDWQMKDAAVQHNLDAEHERKLLRTIL